MGNNNTKKKLNDILIKWETRQIEINDIIRYINSHKNPRKSHILNKLNILQTHMMGDTTAAQNAMDTVDCPTWRH